ncbi:MAG TPA: DUF899 domain-containing protein [Verrucomicrobiae bacterium]|nr:DUF899 domain-containing protein [Verrucomicrobiae bacterium]
MASATAIKHKVVSRDEWLAARKQLLAKEKAFTKQKDAISAERRNLPWVKIEKQYVFEGPNGKATLADLFENKSQLIIYHFMFGPDWEEGCPSCSFLMDHTDGALVHLAQRDVSFRAVSRAPFAKIDAFKKRMGWKFKWVSSYGTDFNYDFHASFDDKEKADYNYEIGQFPSAEGPGLSVFYKDEAGNIFHTYSTYARGTEATAGTYQFLDLVPKGRDEDGLPFTMAWLRHHDRYESGLLADSDRPYWPSTEALTKDQETKKPAASCCEEGHHS